MRAGISARLIANSWLRLGSTTMNQPLQLLLAVLAGMAIGVIYFGGLWLTVQRLPRSSKPVRLLLLSAVVRLGLALGGFYLVLRHGWAALLASLAGSVLTRLFLIRWLAQEQASKGGAHEAQP